MENREQAELVALAWALQTYYEDDDFGDDGEFLAEQIGFHCKEEHMSEEVFQLAAGLKQGWLNRLRALPRPAKPKRRR